MRIALIQLCASDDPAANLPNTRAFIEEAAAEGAGFVLTPEVTNCVSADRAHQKNALQSEADDITLSALAEDAARLVLWLNIGSLALACPDGDGRFVNRSFLISPKGEIVARYDKLHMFDVSLSDEETYRESAGYRPGDRAIVADAGGAKVG
ncbi:MAG: nitrilase-related carbon-nitrogen hydrolase, partial [Pseudomonadota bacterium]